MTPNRDRAAIVTGIVLQIVRCALLDWLNGGNAGCCLAVRAEVEATLRAEFEDCAREATAEIRREDE